MKKSALSKLKLISQRLFAGIYFSPVSLLLGKENQVRLYLSRISRIIEPSERFLLPLFREGQGRILDRYSYQKDYVNFGIKGGEKVLDIGSGADPFPLATHLADLYEGETSHRAGPIVKDGRSFQLCDIEKLPYDNKEFDFVYCSHVLEHAPDPARACEEIMRIGKRGYIETPTRVSDIMFNFTRLKGHHKWHVNLLKNTLIFMEWGEKEHRDTECNDFFLMVHSKYKNPFQDLVCSHRDLFVNMFLWTETFDYYVFDKNGELLQSNRER